MTTDAQALLAEWKGRRSEAVDRVDERLATSFRAILGEWLADTPQDAAPLCLHWCLSPAIAPMLELGQDGHPAKNRDLPPVPNPRRMWAGGSIETFDWLRVGDTVRRVSTIADIAEKSGRPGGLWFVAVDHEYHTPRGLAVRERQDLVYREALEATQADAAKPEARTPKKPEPAQRPVAERYALEPSPVLLFRYSAITFNGHRIHYDEPYAREVEGYDGLVVHGPIQATLLMNLAARRAGKPPARFSYRGLSPAFADRKLEVCAGEDGTVWTQSPDGQVHMQGRAE